MNLAIIPARGGSKRIPRKNIKDFLGKPIISYSINAAIESNLFDEIMVSTDDVEIAEVAKEFGAQIPFYRSERNSNDFATTFDVIEEVVSNYLANGREFNTICCIYPCAPLIDSAKIVEAYGYMTDNNLDSVIPVVEYTTPIQRSFKIQNDKLDFFFNEFINSRSQDLEKAYFDAGQFYWIQSKTFNLNFRYRQTRIKFRKCHLI